MGRRKLKSKVRKRKEDISRNRRGIIWKRR